MSPPRPLHLMPVCERYYGVFLLFWGLLLQYDHFAQVPHGLFYGEMEKVAPGWAWGLFMIALGAGRIAAYRWAGNRLRLRLSATTVALFWVIAAIAFWRHLFGVTFPLCAFLGAWSLWCHRALSRDLSLGL